MRGMKAFEARPKRQNYRDGGLVRGPGTGTSDEVPDEVPEGTFIMPTDSTQAIGEQALAGMGGGARGMGSVTGQDGAAKTPVNLSNGEFKLPPEQVHAVGVQALSQMKEATHAPVRPQARGMKPELFFADGGVVDDEQKRLQNQTAMYVQGAQAAAANRPPEPAPVAAAPAAPAQQSEYSRQMGAVGGSLADGVGWLGKTLVSAPGYGFSVTDGSPPAANTPAARPAPVTPAAPIVPTAPVAAQPGTAAASPTDQRLATGAQQAPSSTAPPSSAGQVAPGVYQHGRGQYSDQASGLGMSAVFTGQPSAQNMQAAQALSDRSQQESINRVTTRGMGAVTGPGSGPVEPGSFTGGFSGVVGGGSGNMMSRTPEQQRRDAEVQASSILRPTADRGRTALASLDALDQQGSKNAGNLDLANVREAGDTSRAFLRDAGDTGRAFLRESGESARASGRNQLDARRIGLEERGQAPKLREAERQDKLYQSYQEAKTPEDRNAIAQQIRDLKGAVQPAEWRAHITPTTKNADGSTTEGSVYRVNQVDGRVEQVGGSQKPPLPPGMKRQVGTSNGKPVYEDMNGKTVVAKG